MYLAIIGPALIGISAACISWWLGWRVGDVFPGLQGWWSRQSRARDVLRRLAKPERLDETGKSAAVFSLSAIRPTWIGMIVGLVGAMAAKDWLVSPVLFLLAYVVGRVQQTHQEGAQWEKDAADAAALIEGFRSVFAVRHTQFGGLEEAAKMIPDGRVAAAVRHAVAMNRLGRSVEECWRSMRDINNPFLNDFIFILERIELADAALTDQNLRGLLARVERRQQRANRARVVLSRVRGTARLLQGGLLAALLVSLVVNLWRSYWLGSINTRIMFLLIAGAVALVTVYLEQQYVLLQEEIS